MTESSLWRVAPRPKRVLVGIGVSVAAVFVCLAVVPDYRSQLQPLLISAAMLGGLSGALLLTGYRRPAKPVVPGPMSEANEAVMPVPEEPPKSAVAQERS